MHAAGSPHAKAVCADASYIPTRRPLPKSPKPTQNFVIRRQRSANKLQSLQSSSTRAARSDAELLSQYEAMRVQLSKLGAAGVLDEHRDRLQARRPAPQGSNPSTPGEPLRGSTGVLNSLFGE